MPRAALAGSYWFPYPAHILHLHVEFLINCMRSSISCGMLIVCKAISEVVAAIATLNQNAPVSLPVPNPFTAPSLLVCVYLPRVQVDPCLRRFCRIRVYFCTAICLPELGRSRLAPVSRFHFLHSQPPRRVPGL